MKIYEINNPNSYEAIKILRNFTKMPGIIFKELILNVKPQPVDSSISYTWPVIFKCTSDEPNNKEFEIRIHNLTCGYGGTGPHDLLECLRITEFDKYIDNKRIFTDKLIREHFAK